MSGSARKTLAIAEFCEAHGISRTLYLTMRRQGTGPDEMNVGGATRISNEAAARWPGKWNERRRPTAEASRRRGQGEQGRRA